MTHHIDRLEPRRFFAIYGLDPTFGVGGRIGLAEQTSGQLDLRAQFVHTQSDGNTIAGGLTSTQGARLHRFTTAGDPDTTFSGAGISDIVPMSVVGGGAVQDDGKILLTGTLDNKLALVRFTADGNLDTTFATGGIATIFGFVAAEFIARGR